MAPVTLAAAGPSYTYQITVKTFDYAAPHKASSVMFQLAGTAGSLPQHTEAGADSWAQAGQVHTFNVTAANVGVVRYIKVTPVSGAAAIHCWQIQLGGVQHTSLSYLEAGRVALTQCNHDTYTHTVRSDCQQSQIPEPVVPGKPCTTQDHTLQSSL